MSQPYTDDESRADEQQTWAEDDAAYAAKLLSASVERWAVVRRLVARGLDRADATALVNCLVEGRVRVAPSSRAAVHVDAIRTSLAVTDIVTGAVVAGIGIAVTLITYAAAANGGVYIVAWGAIIFGIIRVIRGLARRTAGD